MPTTTIWHPCWNRKAWGLDFPQQGEIRKGVIASISPGQILVSVGTKSEGVISGQRARSDPPR